jgi:peptidoglycan/xylan/chitin deacetylase (PgdA/CDA1 family)
MPLRKHADKMRSLLPQGARERLYELHPGRARRWQQHPGLQRVAPTGKVVLTFDDGPDPDATPAVLDALDQIGATATFFLLGTQAVSNPEMAAEIVRRGHEVGLHGNNHVRHDRTEPADSAQDLMDGFEALENVLGVRCSWYRPPYGKMSPAAAQTCAELGMTIVYWSAWGLDWEEVGADRIATVACAQIDDGGIVLLHDSARYARRVSAAPTAAALPMLAANAEARGLSLVALRDATDARLDEAGVMT